MNQVLSVLDEREVEGRKGLRCCCKTADDSCRSCKEFAFVSSYAHFWSVS